MPDKDMPSIEGEVSANWDEDKDNVKKGCRKEIRGNYSDGGHWEMKCGDLNRFCDECKNKEEEKEGKSNE